MPVSFREKKEEKEQEAKDLKMKTLFENEDFLALNKNSGVVVQGAQDNEESLSYHLAFLKQTAKQKMQERYFHVHRLDKETSGVLIIAKNSIALRELNALFREGEVVKKYVCLCVGRFEKKEGTIELRLERTEEGSRQKVRVSQQHGKKTRSAYKVLKEYEYEHENFSLVEVRLFSGFTHQIRVHMAHLRHPIVGDSMYGKHFINEQFKKDDKGRELLTRQFLHAKSISFPYKGKEYTIEADLSEDLKKTLNQVKEKKTSFTKR